MSSLWHDVWEMQLGKPFQHSVQSPRQGWSRREDQSNGHTNQVKTNHFNHNSKYRKTHIEAKVSTTSLYNSLNLRYKLDTGRNNNYIPLHLYKKLYPKASNTYLRQPKTCKLKLRHNEKEKICKFFVAHKGSTSALGMQDIDRLGMLSINCNSKNRQVEEESNGDKGKSQRQTNSDKCEQLKGEIQGMETQSKQDAKDANPMVIGNNNDESIAPLSEVLTNQNSIADTEKKDAATIDLHINYNSIDCIAESVTHHSPFSIEEGEGNTSIIDMQFNYNIGDHFADSLTHYNSFVIEKRAKDMATQNSIITNNNNEGLIVDAGKQNQTVKRRKENKIKTKI